LPRLSGTVLLVALCGASVAQGGAREIEAGVEDFWYRTAETALNRDNFLGLDQNENLLRGALSWKETRGAAKFVFKGFVERSSGADAKTTWTARQAYAQYGWGPGVQVRVGRQRLGWGSGFAWNPTNRLEPPKNPANTALEQEGSLAARLDIVPANWAGVILVAARGETGLGNLPFSGSASERNTGALRVRFLVKNTDLAFVVSGGERQPTLLGLDLGRDLGGVSIHAEAATYQGSEIAPPRPEQRFFRLATGLLWSRDTTSVTAEYFFNGEGYSDGATKTYLRSLDATYAAATNPVLPRAAQQAALARYGALAALPFSGGLGLRRHYLQASWTRSEIRGQWTTALRSVVGLSDGGVALTPGVVYAPRGDFTISLDGVILLGPGDSEYRLAPLRGALQARVKALF